MVDLRLAPLSKSVGTGFPGVGCIWECSVFVIGKIGRKVEFVRGWRLDVGDQSEEENASFAALF